MSTIIRTLIGCLVPVILFSMSAFVVYHGATYAPLFVLCATGFSAFLIVRITY